MKPSDSAWLRAFIIENCSERASAPALTPLLEPLIADIATAAMTPTMATTAISSGNVNPLRMVPILAGGSGRIMVSRP